VNQVCIYHPALDTSVSVPESAVDIHRAAGWIPADEYVPPAEEPAAPAQASAEPVAEEKKPTKAGSRQTAKEQ
jgi:hypothetical protein